MNIWGGPSTNANVLMHHIITSSPRDYQLWFEPRCCRWNRTASCFFIYVYSGFIALNSIHTFSIDDKTKWTNVAEATEGQFTISQYNVGRITMAKLWSIETIENFVYTSFSHTHTDRRLHQCWCIRSYNVLLWAIRPIVNCYMPYIRRKEEEDKSSTSSKKNLLDETYCDTWLCDSHHEGKRRNCFFFAFYIFRFYFFLFCSLLTVFAVTTVNITIYYLHLNKYDNFVVCKDVAEKYEIKEWIGHGCRWDGRDWTIELVHLG